MWKCNEISKKCKKKQREKKASMTSQKCEYNEQNIAPTVKKYMWLSM
jgi:hypothetical protein